MENNAIGVANASANMTLANYNGVANSFAWSIASFAGNLFANTADTAYGSQIAAGSVVGVAVDIDTGKIWFAINNVWVASGNPAAGTGEATNTVTGTIYPYTIVDGAVGTTRIATTTALMTYTPPSGFSVWEEAATTIDITTAGLTSAPTTVAKDTASISTSLVASAAADSFLARTIVSHTGNIATGPATITDIFDADTRQGEDYKAQITQNDSGDTVTSIVTAIDKIV